MGALPPSTVWRTLHDAGRLRRQSRGPSPKGRGFQQPAKPHQHWHTDVSYLNIRGTFYYLCSILDGYSRAIIHWEIRESMTERDVQIILQRAHEQHPDAKPRLISDNGPQFIARDLKELIRTLGMTHVRISPGYPQSNGKIERWHQSLKRECYRPKTPLSLDDARREVHAFVDGAAPDPDSNSASLDERRSGQRHQKLRCLMNAYPFAKRAFDVLLSAVALIVASPLMLLLSLATWLTMGRPVLFRQRRLGLHGRPFTILKFRTMTNARDGHGHLLPDTERTTTIGSLLRATSLDELPQLWNVVKGEMSLVGTRPHPVIYLERYSPEQRGRLEVKPGLTTLSAVNGRNAQSWSSKFYWDLYYVRNQSLWLDLRILARTVAVVISRRGASSVSPMPDYLGTDDDAHG